MIKNKILICILTVSLCLPVFAADESIESKNLIMSQKAMSNPDYVVLPGDFYKLAYNIGSTPIEYPVVVDSTYAIRVSNLGIINVRGKTFTEVKKQVERLVSQNYPLSAVQFVLISPSSFTVAITGEVTQTAEVNAWALSRASSVIGKLRTPFSSLRKITITSANGTTTEYDLFKAFRDGDFSQDPYLRPGDIITVPRAERIVNLNGAVERAGVYELLKDDTLTDVIERYGGGFLPRAGVDKQKLKVSRIRDDSVAVTETFIVDFEKDGANFPLKDRDSIYVEGTYAERYHVYIELPLTQAEAAEAAAAENTIAVKTKVIPISFTAGDTVVSVVRKHLGLFTSMTADAGRAFILRSEKHIPLNLKAIILDPSYNEHIPLEPEDRIIVPAIEQIVTVTGAVIKPGGYPYTPGKTFEYYIALAGGFDEERNARSAVIIRDVYGKKLDKKNIIGPDTIITARSNAFMYNFNMYAPLITVTATVITAVAAVLTITYKK